jgi:hypothetical protein
MERIDALRLVNTESWELTTVLAVLLTDTFGTFEFAPDPDDAEPPLPLELSLVAPLITFAFTDASPGIALT